ncbi:MAG: sodium-dependent bicarbonate transport family permease [Anaerolineae bacterium]
MDTIELIRLNLLSPMVLAFVLGIVAVRVKSDLRIPDQVYDIISIYLLFAIGLKGGFDLATSSLNNFGLAALLAVFLGACIPLVAFWILVTFGRLDRANAVALGIHYGAVSAVTLSACITFLTDIGEPFEGFMPSMYVIMELPAVIIGLLLAQRVIGGTTQSSADMVRAALTSKSFLLLGGGLVIGYLSGTPGKASVAPFFIDLFPGFLTLFLLEMGTLVGQRLNDLRHMGRFLLGFSILMPLAVGIIATALGTLIGLSVGGSMIMGTIAASASYITAPAIVQNNIPQANPGYYLTAALVLTFPFNLSLGLPIYFQVAQFLA